jgi:hypothetical protein
MPITVPVQQILGVFGDYLTGVNVVGQDGTVVENITSQLNIPYDQWNDCLTQLGALYSNYPGAVRTSSVDEIGAADFAALVEFFKIPGVHPINDLKAQLVAAMNLNLNRRLERD